MTADKNIEATFCFVDIAGYTALTESHGEITAADLIDEFALHVRESIEPAGTIHELTGDCAFVVFPDPVHAIKGLAALYELVADRQNFPVLRTGLHHGMALVRENRYFGSTINLAARVAAKAEGGYILGTKQVAHVLKQAAVPDLDIVFQGSVILKNVSEQIDIYDFSFPEFARDYVIDPVCKMQVDKRRAAGHLHFNDRRYWFCSLECIAQFAHSPASHTTAV